MRSALYFALIVGAPTILAPTLDVRTTASNGPMCSSNNPRFITLSEPTAAIAERRLRHLRHLECLQARRP